LGPLLPHLSPYLPQTMDSNDSIKDLPHLFEKKIMFNYCPYQGHMIIMLNYGNKILTCNYWMKLMQFKEPQKWHNIFSKSLLICIDWKNLNMDTRLFCWYDITPQHQFEHLKLINVWIWPLKLMVEMNVLNMHQQFFKGFLEETKVVRCFQRLVDKWQLVKF